MLFGLLNLSFFGLVLATFLLTHITIISVTIYLHRHQAHRSLELHPLVSHFFRFWLWLTTAQNTKEWVAIHRKHHAFTDKPDDPHSPHVYGIHKIVWEGVELYRQEAKNTDTLTKYGHGTPNDWIENHLYTPYKPLGIACMFILDLVLFGIPGISIWAIQMVWIPIFGAGIINGFGHYSGYRNFEIKDMSTNIVPWGLLVGGEELHNNHHTYASSAKFSIKWWEIDLGWFYIKLLNHLKLVKIKKTPPKLALMSNKLQIDIDSVTAIIRNRFQILSYYYHEVILPVFYDEKINDCHPDKTIYGRAHRLLRQDASRFDYHSKTRLTTLLQHHHNLRLVYQFRIDLQNIWQEKKHSQLELIRGLQHWCEKADTSNIHTLQAFSRKIKQYSMPLPHR